MAKSKKKKSGSGFRIPRPWALFHHLSEETRRSIASVFLVVCALVLLLAAAGAAGAAGDGMYAALSYLLGVGYYLVPILFILLAATLLRPIEHTFAYPKIIGGALFLASGLGIVALAFGSDGGILGTLIAAPLVTLLDVAATAIILSALAFISLLVMFDGMLSVATFGRLFSLFRRRDRDIDEGVYDVDEDEIDEEYPEDTEEEAYEDDTEEYEEELPEEDTEEEDEEPEKRGGITGLFGKRKQAAAETPIATFAGDPYTPPPLSLLSKDKGKPGVGDIKANANLIKRTLSNFGIEVELDEISVGPSVTRYAIKPAEGVRLSRIVSLQNNLELALAAAPVRIEAPIPGRSLVGIEVPNSSKATVGLASLMADAGFQESDKPILTALGKSITGSMHFANIAKMPHLLIAGATGSGKSVVIHAIITSLLYRNGPEHLRYILVDPKRVELTLYKNIPHLLTPVITDPKKAILALKWATKEMERRYDILEAETVRDIESYHTKVLAPAREKLAQKGAKATDEDHEAMPEAMPYIVIVIDELADLMQSYPRELESSVVRLAQMSRAVGIHLILSTQRPSVNVITGLIKANIPARIALQVSSQIDSRTILDAGGAERLLGAGDMLYLSGEMSKPQRLQSAYISEDEVKRVVGHLAKAYEDAIPNELSLTNGENGDAEADNPIFASAMEDEAAEDEDELYEDARDVVVRTGKASTSYLQRKLRVGYARAARLMDILEERGVVGPADGAKPREVLETGTDDAVDAEDTDTEETEER